MEGWRGGGTEDMLQRRSAEERARLLLKHQCLWEPALSFLSLFRTATKRHVASPTPNSHT